MAWWGGSARHAATLKAIALFESRHPGVKVKAEYMGFNGYLERLTAQVAGGSEPDVMQINWACGEFQARQRLTTQRAARPLTSQYGADDIKTGRAGR
jgi:oligogalacturonide transport system substrate-binding protein